MSLVPPVEAATAEPPAAGVAAGANEEPRPNLVPPPAADPDGAGAVPEEAKREPRSAKMPSRLELPFEEAAIEGAGAPDEENNGVEEAAPAPP